MSQPDRFGKYEVTAVLGKGAMGVVYQAFDPDIRRPVAIKTIRKELLDDDDQAESIAARFRHEAQAAGRLSHPGIVGVYEYGEDRDFAYIAMEYVEGSSLREYFNRKIPFTEKDAVSLMSQLLDALEHAHEQKVWHRDIKPANLIVTRAGRLKIADFGIARIEASQLTQHGLMMGTPGYMPPEMYLGQQVDHRSDLFAAGVVMYQLLCGEPPFSGAAEAVMYQVCNEEPAPPSRRDAARAWTHYDLLMATALAKKPERRFHSAAAFREAVQSAFARPVSSTISEETVVSVAAKPAPAAAALPAAASTTRGSQQSGTRLPTNWDAASLGQVETHLAQYLGPVARVMVRRAARTSADLPQLVQTLAGELPTAGERDAFTAAVLGRSAATATQPVPTSPRSAPAGAVTNEHIDRAVRLLTPHLGPIARVFARRAAAAAADRRSFDLQLAGTIEDPAERERFLAQLGGAG